MLDIEIRKGTGRALDFVKRDNPDISMAHNKLQQDIRAML